MNNTARKISIKLKEMRESREYTQITKIKKIRNARFDYGLVYPYPQKYFGIQLGEHKIQLRDFSLKMFIQFIKEDNPRFSTIECRGKDVGCQTFLTLSNVNDIIEIRITYNTGRKPAFLIINKQFLLSEMIQIQKKYNKN